MDNDTHQNNASHVLNDTQMKDWPFYKEGPFGLCLLCSMPKEDHLYPVYRERIDFLEGVDGVVCSVVRRKKSIPKAVMYQRK